MAYDLNLAQKVSEYLRNIPNIEVQEQKMYGGLVFMINGKMCVNIVENKLMCRFDPQQQDEIKQRKGYQKLLMGGKEYTGYCYVEEEGYETEESFAYWIDLCLAFNPKAKSSKKK